MSLSKLLYFEQTETTHPEECIKRAEKFVQNALLTIGDEQTPNFETLDIIACFLVQIKQELFATRTALEERKQYGG